MWSSLGDAPKLDEVEVTVLGPGYGESIVVHLGNNEWMIVDSCIDNSLPDKPVAPLKYLNSIGVSPSESVKYIVISHWDDDHVRGVSSILRECVNAEFYCSSVFADQKFTDFIEAISINDSDRDGRNVKSIREVLYYLHEKGKPIKKVVPARQISRLPKIMSWSPSDIESDDFLLKLASFHPKAGEPYRKATGIDSNLSSVVLTIEWPDFAVLLGADMEFSSNPQKGWGAVVSEALQIGVKQSDLVKIPHHGSRTGHDDSMWDKLLTNKPISIVTTFGKGSFASRPPTQEDITRIRSKSGKLHITSRHSLPKGPVGMDLGVIKSLRESGIKLSSKKLQIGIVRNRRISSGAWKNELFGEAYTSK